MNDKTINVLITTRFSDEILERFKAVSPNIKIRVQPAEKEKDIPNRAWQQADVLYTTFFLPPATIKSNITWVHSHFAGIDHLLEDPFVKAHPDIVLTNSSGIHVAKIGEYAVGMILALGHRIPAMLHHQANNEWPRNRFSIFMAQELNKSTVGILGYGRLGREVARLCKAFGATVLATKRDIRQPDSTKYTLPGKGDPEGEIADRLYPTEATAFMLKECDFVVITLPLTEKTRYSFGAEMLEAMKPTAFLVNVGRGEIVQEDALLAALQNERIAGAAFDVFAAEPLPPDHPLWQAPNLIISPHISGNMRDYKEKAAAVFEENLRRFIEKRSLMNVVNRELGY
ncbi:MAG: D-2-hydroxyacid dehydrogenase [Chloroflexi bacterium]|nr:D-2-hydroxyacid dehydrogenase [Chloroflexota bacterium]